MRRVGDQLGRVVDLEQTQIGTAGDGQQHAAGPVHALLQQRAGDRALRRLDRPVVAARTADAHQRRAGVGHHALDVGEVEVDQPWRGDQVGDALDTGQQHLVGLAERVHHAHRPVAELQQPVVRDDDEGVALVAQLVDAGLGLHLAPLALERERSGDHANGQRAQLAGDVRDHRRGPGARTAALTTGHEHHVGALEDLFDLVPVVFGGLAAHVGVGTGAQATGQFPTHVELDVRVGHQQRLRVGVDRDELDALEPDLDHSVDGIDAAATAADDLDDRQVVVRRCHRSAFPSLCCSPPWAGPTLTLN
ncbi:hypothetical protein Athai_24650 [Actinocatenispora thailandica]|uniref:Uncharacterized protein n=1 Tax=Actinocatenispora thailandica TaxID=227318 RepID=A0A7R7DNP9_9ACTN|nr:hypothetical protein Athai_24650 [Actinocatenispora thailandica]